MEPGAKVRCKVSGFTGVVTSRLENLYGPPRVEVTAETLTDGGKIQSTWFYLEQLEAV